MADRQCDTCKLTNDDGKGRCPFCGLPYSFEDRLAIPVREVPISKPGWDLQRNAEIQGWMSESELAWLCDTASRMRTVVEIGCWKGRSTYALASGCPGIVYAVDHFKGNPEELDHAHLEAKTTDILAVFRKNCGHFENLHIMRMTSRDASEYIPSAEMVFIDGSHTPEAVSSDLDIWLPRATKLICGHDAHMDGVHVAVARKFGTIRLAIDSIWAFEVNGHADTRTF